MGRDVVNHVQIVKNKKTSKSDRLPLQPIPVITTDCKGHCWTTVKKLHRVSTVNNCAKTHQCSCPAFLSCRHSRLLTDQRTNFTLRTMRQLHREFGMSAIRASPYHPKTDGLVERFNQTLKKMLRRFMSDSGNDWYKWLPFLLSA